MDQTKSAQEPLSASNTPALTPAVNSQLVPLPPSPQSQIFMHPEHEAGTLGINQTVQTPVKQHVDHKLAIVGIIIVVFSAAAALLIFIVVPRSQNVSFANSTKETVNTSGQKTEDISKSLDILYKARTAQTDDVTLSNSYQVQGATSQSGEIHQVNFFYGALELAQRSREAISSNEKVKGFAVPAYDPNKESRKHRDLANDISSKADEAQEVNKKLLELKNKSVPGSAKDLQQDVKKLQDKNKKYIDQSYITAQYYVALSDSAIELTNLATSLYTAKDVENAISKLTTLKTKFSEYGELPEGIEDYNKDIVETFDLLIVFFKDVQNGSIVTQDQAVNAYNNFVIQIQSISQRAVIHEIDFWQKNEALSSFEELSEQHTQVLKEAEKLKDNNNFFLLEWAGAT